MVLGWWMLSACDAPAPQQLPADPPAVVRFSERPFGDVLYQRSTAAWFPVFDALKPQYPKLRILERGLKRGTAVQTLEAYYTAQLAPHGFQRLAEWTRTEEAQRFTVGFGTGQDVVVLVGVPERREDTKYPLMPMVILTTLAGAGD